VGQEKIRGRVRVHVMMGSRAFQDYGRKLSLAQDLSRALTCGESAIVGRVEELVSAEREATRELRRLRLERAGTDAETAVAAAPAVGGALFITRVFDGAGPDYLKAFAEKAVAAPGRLVVALDRSPEGFQWIVAHSLGGQVELPRLLSPEMLGIAGAKGGGRGARMQGVGTKNDAVAAFADAIERAVARVTGGPA